MYYILENTRKEEGNMNNKLIPIIALSLIGVIAIATIVMACINKSYEPNLNTPDMIAVSANGQTYESTDTDVFDSLLQEYKDSFKESSINALFQGRIANGAEGKYLEDVITSLSSISSYISLDYNTEQSITIQNEDFVYDRAVVSLTTDTELNTVKIYLFAPGTTATSYYIETIANFSALNDYIDTL